jgi:hypothetical protein
MFATGLCLPGNAVGNGLAGDARLQTIIGLPANDLDAAGIPAQQAVFSRESDWVDFWQAHSSAPAPIVDFSRWQIAAIFLGPRPNPGYHLRVPYAYEIAREQTTYLYYEEVRPKPGAVYAQLIVYAYQILAVPSALRIEFKPVRLTAPEQLARKAIVPQTLPVAALQRPKRPTYAAFLDRKSWEAFWKANAASPPPAVDFDHGIVVGLMQPSDAPAVNLSRVEEQGGTVHVSMVRGPANGERTSLLVVIPRAARVDFGWVEPQL